MRTPIAWIVGIVGIATFLAFFARSQAPLLGSVDLGKLQLPEKGSCQLELWEPARNFLDRFVQDFTGSEL